MAAGRTTACFRPIDRYLANWYWPKSTVSRHYSKSAQAIAFWGSSRRTTVRAIGTDVRLLYLVRIGTLAVPYRDPTSDITIRSDRLVEKAKPSKGGGAKLEGLRLGPASQDSQLPKRDDKLGSQRHNGPCQGRSSSPLQFSISSLPSNPSSARESLP